jgi:hypothetical protein
MSQRDFTDRAPFCLSLYHVSPINLVSHFTASLLDFVVFARSTGIRQSDSH